MARAAKTEAVVRMVPTATQIAEKRASGDRVVA
jgi:hypothetical protein